MAKHVSGSVMYPEPTLMGEVFERKSWVKFEPAKNNWQVSSQVAEEDLKKAEISTFQLLLSLQRPILSPFTSLYFSSQIQRQSLTQLAL